MIFFPSVLESNTGMRSLERRAVDALVAQLLAKVGGDARVVGPGAALTPLDAAVVGVLKPLLLAAFPGTPEAVLSSVRDDLVVVTRVREAASDLVMFEPATLRVAQPHADGVEAWQDTYGELLHVTIQRGRHLDTDLNSPTLTFHEDFFAPRSIRGWAKLVLHFARLCASMDELRALSGLRQRDVYHEHRDGHLVPTQIVDAHGEPVELAQD